MGKLIIEGSFVALITPFKDDGNIDFEGFKKLIDFQELNNTSAVLIMGSTGEASALSIDEKKEIISKTMKLKHGKMLHFYGCTGNSTKKTIELVKHAAEQGADGAITTVPSYMVPSIEDAIQYYIEIANVSSIPIGIYNNPTRVGTDLPSEAIIQLADHPNIIIDKEAMGRPGQIAKILSAKKEISLMCCDSPNLSLIIPVMALGGQGTANVTGNVAPQEMAILSKPWTDYNDAINCREAYLKILPLLYFNYSRINPVPIKSLMKVLGLPAGDLRKPNQMMSLEELGSGINIVDDLGLAEKYNYSIPKEMASSKKRQVSVLKENPSSAANKCVVWPHPVA